MSETRKQILNTADVARILRVGEEKVYSLIASGARLADGRTVKLPASNIGSGRRSTWKFTVGDVEDFIEATRVCDAPPERVHRTPVVLAKRYIARRPANSV